MRFLLILICPNSKIVNYRNLQDIQEKLFIEIVTSCICIFIYKMILNANTCENLLRPETRQNICNMLGREKKREICSGD